MVMSFASLCLFCREVHEQGDARDGSDCGNATQLRLFVDSPGEESPRPNLEQLELLG